MAKQKSLIHFQGTFYGVTNVKSSAYGEHIRAVRGTHKPAIINEALKKSAGDMVMSNLPAKIIKDALTPLRENFGGGLLWQRLVSLFKAQYKRKSTFDFTELKGWEVLPKHPMSKLITFSKVFAKRTDETITLHIHYEDSPAFKFDDVDGYRFSALAIFPMLEKKTSFSELKQLPVLPISSSSQAHFFSFAIPDGASVAVIALKLEGCSKGKPDGSYSSQGLMIVEVVKW
jgi:hypothetical protein